MLTHVDSPYIRCIGFLYLRYAADPSTLYSWYEPYLYDDESVQIRQGKSEITVGMYVRLLLENQEYYGTRLPRLPLLLERQFKVKLLQAERIEERAKLHLGNTAGLTYFQKVGSRIQALYGDDENPVTWYDAVVDRVITRDDESGELLIRPKFQVTFPEYGNTEIVTLGEIDLPGSHGVGESAAGVDGGSYQPNGDHAGSDSHERRGCGRGYDDYHPRGHDGRGGRMYNDDNKRGRDDGYNRSGRDLDCRRHDNLHRERSRSRDRPGYKSREQEERELMDEVLRREREKSAAKGKAYAARPMGFRGVNADDSNEGRHDVQDKWVPHPKARHDHTTSGASSAATAAPVVKKKTAEDLAAIEEKKRKLAARYG